MNMQELRTLAEARALHAGIEKDPDVFLTIAPPCHPKAPVYIKYFRHPDVVTLACSRCGKESILLDGETPTPIGIEKIAAVQAAAKARMQ